MRFSILIFFLCSCASSWSQFQFKGQVSELLGNQKVYLSLVEDYRKTSRVYLDQIIQTTTADSLGYFSFEGNALPQKNRIYRIHVDGCEEGLLAKNHFLRECPSTESLLFVANNRDTLTIPLLSGQAFCEVSSTNSASSAFLEIDALKEEMIVDFYEFNSETANALHFDNWFKKFQDFGIKLQEPLAELYIHDFLSDRRNETYAHYLETLANNPHYDELLARLRSQYPEAKFTLQFERELSADKNLIASNNSSGFGIKSIPRLFWYALLLLALIIVSLFFWKRKRISSNVLALTPQELKIANAIKEGKTNKEIASELFISISTVKTHINSIYKKLEVGSRKELLSKI